MKEDQQALEEQIVAILNEYVTPYRYDFTTAAKHIAALQRTQSEIEQRPVTDEQLEEDAFNFLQGFNPSLVNNREVTKAMAAFASILPMFHSPATQDKKKDDMYDGDKPCIGDGS